VLGQNSRSITPSQTTTYTITASNSMGSVNKSATVIVSSETSISPNYVQVEKTESLGPIGTDASQYSPWVMYKSGWGSYLMYYCKNTPIDGVYRDRVWRGENWGDGKTGWEDGQVVIQATSTQSEDDLSCSPGVVIAGNTWHMYYTAANRDTPLDVYLYHATASAPGVDWQKLGRVRGISPTLSGYLETPSPLYQNGNIILYFIGPDHGLYKATSLDGTNFSSPVKLNAPISTGGRVTFSNGVYYYTYSREPSSVFLAPTAIYLSTSADGINFSNGQLLFSASGSDWDSGKIWSPHTFFENQSIMRIYYAGNSGEYPFWWGLNSSMGVRSFNIQSS